MMRSRIAAIVSPSSRMSSSTSTTRSFTDFRRRHAPLHLVAALGRVAIARQVDVVELEREIEVRQQHAGEHRRAAHHRQHEREVLARRSRGWRAPCRSIDALTSLRRNDFFGVAENVESFFAIHDV